MWILTIFLGGSVLVVGFLPSTNHHVDVIMICFKLKVADFCAEENPL